MLPCGCAAVPPVSVQAPPAVGVIRTDSLFSPALGVGKRFIVYLPPSYDASGSRRYPVAYYLHGLGGAEVNWTRQGRLAATMDSLVADGMPEMIVVMPDGDDGFYTNWPREPDYAACVREHASSSDAVGPRPEPAASYCVRHGRYDDYIARDLIGTVDARYRTLPDGAHRAVAGLSMGGYGALALALRHPDRFAAAASHSGVLSLLYIGPRPFAAPTREPETMDTLLAQYPERSRRFLRQAFGEAIAEWRARDPARLAAADVRRREPVPALFVDIGRADERVDRNRAFAAALDSLGVSLHYAEWPGAHTWDYWRAHLPESLRWIAGIIAVSR